MFRQGPYGHKADIWALGCILYEMMALTEPFKVGDGGGKEGLWNRMQDNTHSSSRRILFFTFLFLIFCKYSAWYETTHTPRHNFRKSSTAKPNDSERDGETERQKPLPGRQRAWRAW